MYLFRKKKIVKATARIMFCVLAIELALPTTQSLALTSGPSQPEYQSFEPVGTTDMVDLFSGDFVYNIPLLDVEGYPINISYHSGVGMEDEASWVGLGWNINVGVINRGVRGIPDDFNGEQLIKEYTTKDEKNYRFTTGVTAEFFGKTKDNNTIDTVSKKRFSANASLFVSLNNYKGMGVGFSTGFNLSIPTLRKGQLGVGGSATVSSMEGATIDAHASASFRTTGDNEPYDGSMAYHGSTGFNSRSGLKNISYGVSYNTSLSGVKQYKNMGQKVRHSYSLTSHSFGSSIPIGFQNYVSSSTNTSNVTAFSFTGKLGTELWGFFPNFMASLTSSTLHHDNNGSRKAFGYLYLQNSEEKDIQDFSRERDGIYNKTMPNLPVSNMTYDIYAISGQGTGGSFRPFRNDIGIVGDPHVSSTESQGYNVSAEFGLGQLFELGADLNWYKVKSFSGKWLEKKFSKNTIGSIYENVYFKQGGELTYSQSETLTDGKEPHYINSAFKRFSKNHVEKGFLPTTTNKNTRNPRSNNISFLTNEQIHGDQSMFYNKNRKNYTRNTFLNHAGAPLDIESNKIGDSKPHHIGEITQILPDGRIYVYGQTAKNNIQRESTFSVPGQTINTTPFQNGLVGITSTLNSKNNDAGREKLYQSTITPAYAHSYLLTSVLSSDYSDITGDGPSEDDLGTYHKFNYSLVDKDFRWVSPYSTLCTTGQFIPGIYSDNKDDKASIIMGSKELWYLHSIESKNYIAEFYTSARDDGKGVTAAVSPNLEGVYGNIYHTVKGSESQVYKLDSIKVYNKLERISKAANAIPIKSVHFKYNYTLCGNVHNNTGAAPKGKLTLTSIHFKYGNSQKSLINPYQFTYSSFNPNYAFGSNDRWGTYKPNNATLPNFEFPYSIQDKDLADQYASAWQLTNIRLPSGGKLTVNYESDDYAYVQNKEAMEMIKIVGMGLSTAFAPKDKTYENEGTVHDYLYFKRELTREFSGKSIKENYLPNDQYIYFSCFLDVASKNRFEPIKAYAKVEAMGICDGNNEYAYIKLAREDMGAGTNLTISPITLAGLNFGRYYMGHILYEGASLDGESPWQQITKGLEEAIKELFTIGKNINKRFVQDNKAKYFNKDKFWVRLNSPGLVKKGGGSRVKRIELSDVWNQMVSGAEHATVGLQYEYTINDEQYGNISSGVASYEPQIGGDENPLKQPIKYTADGGRLLAAIELFQEEPIGESFYPSPSVGYRKVTVSSIHKDVARSSKGIDEYEFYTAKDFPVIVDKTPIQNLIDKRSLKSEQLSISQGFTLILNDMHGKPKSVTNSVLKNDEKEQITRKSYIYYQDDKGRLDNTVKAVKRTNTSSHFKPEYEIETVTLGQESDITIDSRMRSSLSTSVTLKPNLNTINAFIIPIPIPTIFDVMDIEDKVFQSITATKVIQQYGILKTTEVIDHGALNKIENQLFDAETGQVLLTKVNNEFNDPVTTVEIPAYWSNHRMGGAYNNLHYETVLDSLYINCLFEAILIDNEVVERFNFGDELEITLKDEDNVESTHRVWINDGSTTDFRDPEYCDTLYSYEGRCLNRAVPRNVYIDGNIETPWTTPQKWHKNVKVKVLRSGRRNMLTSSIQNVSKVGSVPLTSFSSIFANFTTNILSASATVFDDWYVQDYPITFDCSYTLANSKIDSFKFNDFVLGKRGFFKPIESYTYVGDRNYSNVHSRKDGVFNLTNLFWKYAQPPLMNHCIEDYGVVNGNAVGWTKVSTIYYNDFGLPVQEVNAAGLTSAAQYAFNHSLPHAVADNSSYKQIRYFNFEEADMLINNNAKTLRLNNTFSVLNIASATVSSNNLLGRHYSKLHINAYGANTEIANIAHSGNRSLKLNNSSGLLELGRIADFNHTDNNYLISFWAKPVSTSFSGGSFFIRSFPVSGGGVNTFGFNIVTKSIDGWYKVEIRMPLTETHHKFALGSNIACYIDDVRVHHQNANMKSFVYDPFTFRLMAELDENNFASFYEYDSEGNLVRTKKETEKGILTINEGRKSFTK